MKLARIIHFFQASHFRREILIVLIIKFLLLTLLASYYIHLSYSLSSVLFVEERGL